MPSSKTTAVASTASMQRAFEAVLDVSIQQGGWGAATDDKQDAPAGMAPGTEKKMRLATSTQNGDATRPIGERLARDAAASRPARRARALSLPANMRWLPGYTLSMINVDLSRRSLAKK
ncbi:MAG: hypothetical protein ACRYHA_04600 [Janthinobacterium lividum]